MILSSQKERARFFRFAIVGSIGAIIDIGLFNLLIQLFKIPALTAQAFSFSIAVISNFTWNRLWTYPDARGKPLSKQLFQFVTVSVLGLLLRTLIFDSLEGALINLGHQVLPPGFLFSAEVIGHNLTLASVIIIILFWNFIVNRYWTYNDVNK